MRKVLTTIRKITGTLIWILLISAVLFTAAGLILVNKYGDRIQEYTLEQINQQLQTKVSVEEIDISFFSRIPYLSVVFKDVVVWSSHTFNRDEFKSPSDTLMSAEKIFLQLNLIDVIRGKYRVRRVYATNGKLTLLTDAGAGTNFQILKDKQKGKSGRGKAFEIEAVRLSDFDFYFNNRVKKINTLTRVDNILLKGKFSRSEFSLGTAAGFRILSLERDGIRYAEDYEISMRLVMNVKDSLYQIDKGEVVLNNIKMNTRGKIEMGPEPFLDVEFASRGFSLGSVISSLPAAWKAKVPGKLQGSADLAIRASGPFTRVKTPSIEAAWMLDISEMEWKERKLRNLRLLGKYSNGEKTSPESTRISVEKFSFRDYNSNLTGKLDIENLKRPYLDMDLKGEADLSFLNDFIPDGELQKFRGRLISDLTLRTRLTSFTDIKLEDFFAGGIAGNLQVEELRFDVGEGVEIREVSGKVDFAGDTWYPDASFMLNGESTSLSLRFDHVSRYLFSDEFPLTLSGSIESAGLLLSPFFAHDKKDKKSRSSIFPERLKADLEIRSGYIEAGNFTARDVSAGLRYHPGFLSLENISLQSSEGTLRGKAAMMAKPGKSVEIRSVADLYNIRINELFTSFNNFGQEFIKDENLEGYLTANVTFRADFDSLWNLDKESLYTRAGLTIREGELIDFEPAKKLSRFIEVEELERIAFSTLENQILIEEGSILIPEMDISSSAFDISVSGTHSFDNYLDYKMKIRLSELLTRKARRAKKENEENFVVEDDPRRASIYLSITGNSNDPEVKYDQKQAMASVKEDLREEKKNLKTILNEEFGLFDKDSTVQKSGPDRESPRFILEWDEEESETADTTRKRKRRR